MNWTKGGYQMLVCGDYAVTKHHMRLTEPQYEYLAWYGKGVIGTFDTAEEAKQACANHGRKGVGR